MDTLPAATLRNSATPRLVLLDDIAVPDTGLRRTATSAEQDAGMVDSVQRLGVLQPIILRPDPAQLGRYILVAGRRRYRAARAAGLGGIPAEVHDALTDADATAIEAAENMQRAAMAPVDQWRALARLQDLGWDLDGAAAALGLPQRLARRLAKLGRLHPDMLAAIEQHGMPQDRELATVANASHELQAAALGKKRHAWSWWDIAAACREARIPKGRAIFDAAASGLVWEEDLFAQPGAPDQFTTRDVAGFLLHQKAALEAAAKASHGRIVVAAESYGHPKIAFPHTRIYVWTWGDEIPAGHQVHAFIRDHDGQVVPACVKKLTKTEAAEDPDAEPGDDDDAGDDTTPAARRPREAPGRITHEGRQILAQAKTDALRAAIRDGRETDPWRLLRLLLITLGSESIVMDAANGDDDVYCAEIMAAALRADDEAMLAGIAREAMARILRVSPRNPKGDGYTGYGGSGAAAEIVGQIIGADGVLPRLDTAQLLGTLNDEALADACLAAGITPGKTAAATRKALEGHAEGALLPEARFGGPIVWTIGDTPNPAECGARTGKAECDQCSWTRAAKGKDAEPCSASIWGESLSRLGLTLDDIEVDSALELARLKDRAPKPSPAPEDFDAQRAEDANAFDQAEPAAKGCAWDGVNACRSHGKPACRTCPDRGAYEAWLATPRGEVARKAWEDGQPSTPPATFDCGWTGQTMCREDGTTRCAQLCPRHEKYAAWMDTTAGRAAKRAQENADARASLKRARGSRKPTDA